MEGEDQGSMSGSRLTLIEKDSRHDTNLDNECKQLQGCSQAAQKILQGDQSRLCATIHATSTFFAAIPSYLVRMDVLGQAVRCVQVQHIQRLVLDGRVLSHAGMPPQISRVQDQLQTSTHPFQSEHDPAPNTQGEVLFGIFVDPFCHVSMLNSLRGYVGRCRSAWHASGHTIFVPTCLCVCVHPPRQCQQQPTACCMALCMLCRM